MRILAIDPGTATTGFAVVDFTNDDFSVIDYGVVLTKSTLSTHRRLREIFAGMIEQIERHNPDCMAIEQLFFNVNVRTAMAVGQARGVCLLAAANREIPIAEYTPLQIKQAVAGYGRAGKEQVQQMVRVILKLGEIPKPDDAADALALAICHAHSHRNEKMTERAR